MDEMLNRFADKVVKCHLNEITHLLRWHIVCMVRCEQESGISILPVYIKIDKQWAINTFLQRCVLVLHKMCEGAASDFEEFHTHATTAVSSDHRIPGCIAGNI